MTGDTTYGTGRTEAETIADLARASQTPTRIGTVNGRDIFQAGRDRFSLDGSAAASVYDGDSFVALVDRYRVDDPQPTVFVDVPNLTVVAVLNDGQDGDAGWRDHTVSFTAKTTTEWDRWINQEGQLHKPVDLARIVEAGEDDIVAPPFTTLMDLLQTLRANVDAKVSAGEQVKTGARTTGVQEVIEIKGRDDVAVPENLELSVAPIEGSRVYAVEADVRARVSVDLGGIGIGYWVTRRDDYLKTAFEDVIATIRASLDEHALFVNGPAPSPRTL